MPANKFPTSENARLSLLQQMVTMAEAEAGSGRETLPAEATSRP